MCSQDAIFHEAGSDHSTTAAASYSVGQHFTNLVKMLSYDTDVLGGPAENNYPSYGVASATPITGQ
jgi:hypothetical protein